MPGVAGIQKVIRLHPFSSAESVDSPRGLLPTYQRCLMRAIQRFGKQLQRLRTHRGLTQEQLAVTAGLSRAFLTRLELGQQDPSLSTLVRVAKALRV